MSIYTNKMVDGVEVPLTSEEIAELEARDLRTVQQINVMKPDPGYGRTIKDTLVTPRTGQF